MAAAIKFEPMGIGDLLRRGRLIVPPNQRSYAWEERNVLELLQDLNAAMTPASSGEAAQEYFLGTIVLVDPEDGNTHSIRLHQRWRVLAQWSRQVVPTASRA